MEVAFEMIYDKCNMKLTVYQNKKKVGDYSYFSRCNNQPFEKWYASLPSYCADEANTNYKVVFIGGELLSLILRKNFITSKNCLDFSYKNSLIRDYDRVRWLNNICKTFTTTSMEILVYSNINLDFQNSCYFNCQNNYYKFSDMDNIPIYIKKTEQKCNSDIYIFNSQKEYHDNFLNTNKSGLVLIIDSEKIDFLETNNKVFVFRCNFNDIVNLIRNWLYDIILPKYYNNVTKSVLSSAKTMDNKFIWAKMLVASKPFIELKIIDKVELNMPIRFELVKYPEDIGCKISVSNPNIARLSKDKYGHMFNPLSEGVTDILAWVSERPEIMVKKQVEVYKFIKVKNIQLSLPQNNITVGDSFSLTVLANPSNADNINQKKWSISTNGVISIISDGKFRAISAGSTSVSLKIGDVSSNIVITVFEKPKYIKFDKSNVTVKLGDNSQQLHCSVYPINCINANVIFKTSNSNIVSYDVNNEIISTHNEGTSDIIALLVDDKGTVISDTRCMVRVEPPKDIVTPNVFSVIQYLFFVSFIFLYNISSIRNFCAVLFVLLSIIDFFCRKRKNTLKIVNIVISIILIIIIIFGG